MAEPDTEQDWFESAWEYREETIYPELFGITSDQIYPVPWNRLEKANLTDPRWATCGVMKFPPAGERATWLYVTSGLSNAWFDERPNPDSVSGFGCEFLIELTEDKEWAIQRLHQLMIYQIQLCCGHYPGSEPLSDFHRVPLGSPMDWEDSALTHVLLAPPPNLPEQCNLSTGSFTLIAAVGITESERDYAKQSGSDQLLEKLIACGAFPVTNPRRSNVTEG